MGKSKEIDEILFTSVAMAYLELVLFEKYKDECDMCYEKAEKALKKLVGNEEKEKVIVEKAKEWVKVWTKE